MHIGQKCTRNRATAVYVKNDGWMVSLPGSKRLVTEIPGVIQSMHKPASIFHPFLSPPGLQSRSKSSDCCQSNSKESNLVPKAIPYSSPEGNFTWRGDIRVLRRNELPSNLDNRGQG
jgi:hypothetical protein